MLPKLSFCLICQKAKIQSRLVECRVQKSQLCRLSYKLNINKFGKLKKGKWTYSTEFIELLVEMKKKLKTLEAMSLEFEVSEDKLKAWFQYYNLGGYSGVE